MMKAWQQQHEGADHTTPAVRKQREVNTGVQLIFRQSRTSVHKWHCNPDSASQTCLIGSRSGQVDTM